MPVNVKWAYVLAIAFLAFGATPAWPQMPPATTADKMPTTGTRLILLGTVGGPNIRSNRSQPASLLVVNGRPYLIDCGDGTIEQLQKVGFKAANIAHVFLTHLHLDHVAGLASLIGFNWTAGSTNQPVNIYGPPGTTELVNGAEAFLGVPEGLFSAVLPSHPSIAQMVHPHDWHVTGKQLVFQDDLIKVFAVENSHYSAVPIKPADYGSAISYSYRIVTPQRTFVFTGDTGPDAAVTALAQNADVLISEVINIDKTLDFIKSKYQHVSADAMAKMVNHQEHEHLTPQEIGRMATRAKVKMVVLNHIVPGTDDERSSIPYVAGVRQFYGGVVIAGRDLDEY